jgi:GNAT superfamily N-acetyltransferase
VLESLPTWFGIPESTEEYIAHTESTESWAAVDEYDDVVGVLSPTWHRGGSAEIHLIAVLPQFHRFGVGRMLVEAFESEARRRLHVLAQVKTLGPSHPDEGYAATRQFYIGLGYLPLEEFMDLWDGTPALILVKPLVNPGEATSDGAASVA